MRHAHINSFDYWVICMLFCCQLIFQNIFFLNILSGILSESQIVLDPNQARHFVGPDLDQNQGWHDITRPGKPTP